MGYGLDGRGIGYRFPAGARDFLFSTLFRPVLGPIRPPVQWVPGVKPQGRQGDETTSYSTEVKNNGALPPPFSPYLFVTYFSKHRETFTFTGLIFSQV
jgi:hypothetical protein